MSFHQSLYFFAMTTDPVSYTHLHDLSKFPTAKPLRSSQWKLYNMFHGLQTQICCYAKSAQMRAHKTGNVY